MKKTIDAVLILAFIFLIAMWMWTFAFGYSVFVCIQAFKWTSVPYYNFVPFIFLGGLTVWATKQFVNNLRQK